MVGCQPDQNVVTSVPATAVYENTPTPTPLPARIILYDPSNIVSGEVQAYLAEFSSSNTLSFETWTVFGNDLANIKGIVLLGDLPNLLEISASNPGVQFVVLGAGEKAAGNNISLIGVSPMDLAFMAGYLSMLTATDWRAGGLVLDETGMGQADAFDNGGKYLCGNCTPLYGPFLYYPAVQSLTSQSDIASWTAQAAYIVGPEVNANSIFIDRSGDDEEVLSQFSGQILYSNDPGSTHIDRYAAILGYDFLPALQTMLPEILSGQGGKSLIAKVSLMSVNNEIVSPGRQALFEKTAQDLAQGWINPLSVP